MRASTFPRERNCTRSPTRVPEDPARGPGSRVTRGDCPGGSGIPIAPPRVHRDARSRQLQRWTRVRRCVSHRPHASRRAVQSIERETAKGDPRHHPRRAPRVIVPGHSGVYVHAVPVGAWRKLAAYCFSNGLRDEAPCVRDDEERPTARAAHGAHRWRMPQVGPSGSHGTRAPLCVTIHMTSLPQVLQASRGADMGIG